MFLFQQAVTTGGSVPSIITLTKTSWRFGQPLALTFRPSTPARLQSVSPGRATNLQMSLSFNTPSLSCLLLSLFK